VSKIHWIVYAPGLFLVILGAGSVAYTRTLAVDERIALMAAGAVALIGVLSLIRAWFRRFTTELAVTDRRIVYKRGFVRRHTMEMNMDKVESVDVDQSILGRILDFGDITVRGTGAGIEPLKGIDSPIAFRNNVTAR
jgi:uncharacterized membrane protein YdbT with pleckstrin-like domain